MKISANVLQVVGFVIGATRRFAFVPGLDIHWPNNGDPPVNRPKCGFTGDDPACQSTG